MTEGQIKLNSLIIRIYIYGILFIWFILAGRLFCGKICPIGLLQDLIFKIPFSIKIRTFKNDKHLRLIKYIILIFHLCFMALIAFGLIFEREKVRIEILPLLEPIIIILIGSIFIILRRSYCKYFCMFGAISSLGNKISIYKYQIKKNKCIKCNECSKVCKMNLVPYIKQNSLECIRCGCCKKACSHRAIVSGFNLKKTNKR